MDKEQLWLKNRVGRITASELGDIMSASGKIIDGNITYIRGKRWERRHGYALSVSARTMDIGNENEPLIFEWLKANYGAENVVYSKDPELGEIPFWINENMPFFGASPDAFTFDHDTVFEFKTLVGNETTFFYMDEYTPYEEKKARVMKEHGDQLMGLFLSDDRIKRIVLVKYAYQRDDIPGDTDSPLAPWRGLTFTFEREDYEASIAETKNRIVMFNAMIDAHVNPVDFKSGNWVLKDGKLYKLPEEPKKK